MQNIAGKVKPDDCEEIDKNFTKLKNLQGNPYSRKKKMKKP